MIQLITGAVVLVLTAIVFWYCLPRDDKTHRLGRDRARALYRRCFLLGNRFELYADAFRRNPGRHRIIGSANLVCVRKRRFNCGATRRNDEAANAAASLPRVLSLPYDALGGTPRFSLKNAMVRPQARSAASLL